MSERGGAGGEGGVFEDKQSVDRKLIKIY